MVKNVEQVPYTNKMLKNNNCKMISTLSIKLIDICFLCNILKTNKQLIYRVKKCNIMLFLITISILI